MDMRSTGLATDEGVLFTGNWRSFARIAAANFALTVVTLGAYRFWAKARERRYLWSNTRILGHELEWSGSGGEMFVGFLLAMPIFLPVMALIGFGLPALAGKVHWSLFAAASAASYLLFFTMVAFARFRALRYRLSRTRWRGIRGGSNDNGLRYTARALGWYAVAFFSLGILYPWTHKNIWNQRWRPMSFGPLAFRSDTDTRAVRGHWAVVWICFAVANAMLLLFTLPGIIIYGPGAPGLVVPLLCYATMGLAFLAYNSRFLRSAVDWMGLGEIDFTLDVDFDEWMVFHLQTFGLAIVTLGLAMLFYGYRKWRFLVSRLEIHGTIDPQLLTQSATRGSREAEGLADAFDIGAF